MGRWNSVITHLWGPRRTASRTRGSAGAVLVAVLLVLSTIGAASCGDSGTDIDNDVLGVSVVTSPLGRAHIAIAGSSVRVELPEMTSETTLGLARDGEVITKQTLDVGAKVDLSAEENGLYELVAIEEGDAVATGDAELGQSTAITRLTVVRIGE